MNNHYLRNPTTKLDVTNYNTGCARPTAVAPKPLDLWRCFQGKSWRKYLYFAYKSGFKGLRAILRAVEAVKVKLWCFKGIVHPTHFQKQVGWGTWLQYSHYLQHKYSHICNINIHIFATSMFTLFATSMFSLFVPFNKICFFSTSKICCYPSWMDMVNLETINDRFPARVKNEEESIMIKVPTDHNVIPWIVSHFPLLNPRKCAPPNLWHDIARFRPTMRHAGVLLARQLCYLFEPMCTK